VGLALIELLVAVVIIALLAGAFYGFWRHGKSGQKSMPEQAKEKAQGVDCRARLQQARASIEMAKMDNDDRPPASIPPDMASYAFCPETSQPYGYDPQTGRVWCTTPGHEEF
jgi:prepilin-type N-terminal cleavage/methylation domain-containing protein